MVSRYFLIIFWYLFWVISLWAPLGEAVTSNCSSKDDKPIKVEAWLSKQYEKIFAKYVKNFLQWEIRKLTCGFIRQKTRQR